MEAFLVSTIAVAMAEIGDKTQLLALVLAARFRRPWPIIAGILVATLANHAVAAALGSWVATMLAPQTLQWLVAASFLGMGVWMLIPDKADDAAADYRFGAFLTTLIAFFIVEIGDKTQIATAVLAVRYEDALLVVLGSTLGMLAANAPVVLLGNFAAERLPLRLIHILSAALFVALAVAVLINGPLSMPG